MDRKLTVTRGGVLGFVAIGLAILALTVSLLGNATTFKTARDARQANERTYHALCDFKGELRARRDSTINFLKLTHAERVKKYGEAIANIPEASLLQDIDNQNKTLASLSALNC